MAKPEWGTKRTCPNCGERFYDLGKESPVGCINCAHEWVPEPILKSKQPILAAAKDDTPVLEKDPVLGDDDEDSDDIDLGDDDDDMLPDVSLDDEDDEEVSGMLDTSLTDDED